MSPTTNGKVHPRVAVLGLGTMGGGMVRRLLEEGFAVDVWNRSPGPAATLAEAGATAHPTAAAAVARAGVVLTMLPTAAAVSEVMLAGVLEALRPEATWVQMGTIGVEATERLAADVSSRRADVAFVDAPVSGSREPARRGRLTILASGPDRAQAILEPVFAALGQRTVWLGPAAGLGTRLKLVLNALLAFEIEAVAEVDALAARLGVPYADLVDAVAGGPLASAFEMSKLAKMEGGDHSADFSLEWALKDLDLALAASGPETAPVARAIAERWRRLVEDGYGRLDVSAARLGLEDAAGRAPMDARAIEGSGDRAGSR